VSDAHTFSLGLSQVERFQFDVTFDNAAWPPLRLDEPVPLGDDSAPNASRILAAAVGNCLSASLLFCLEKSRVPVKGLQGTVTGEIVRNAKGRMRIGAMKVVLHPVLDGVPVERMARCLDLFEDFCVVTQSVRGGIDVQVSVEAETG
jgi:organic hydroperoxide reductase OsmC/OhrA